MYGELLQLHFQLKSNRSFNVTIYIRHTGKWINQLAILRWNRKNWPEVVILIHRTVRKNLGSHHRQSKRKKRGAIRIATDGCPWRRTKFVGKELAEPARVELGGNSPIELNHTDKKMPNPRIQTVLNKYVVVCEDSHQAVKTDAAKIYISDKAVPKDYKCR